MISTLFIVVTIILVGSAVIICFYHLGLAFIQLLPHSELKKAIHVSDKEFDFAIVIPAHNEEQTIESTLHSCAALDYPKQKYTVYVIADNCLDHTARVARSFGAVCLERHDETRRGKGQALEWALPQILENGHMAIVIVDADCRLDTHALQTFSSHLQCGRRVLQANHAFRNPNENLLTYLQALANVLENEFFYAPKSRLGLAVILRGTGFVLHRDVLQRHPWQANSVVEDAEYACMLLREGEAIHFIPDVTVESAYSSQYQHLLIQRTRWISGGTRLAKQQSLRLLVDGISRRRPILADAGFTLLIISRPFVILHLLLSIVAALSCVWLIPGVFSNTLLICGLGVILAYFLYAVLGAIQLGINRRTVLLLVQLPAAIFIYLFVAIKAVFGYQSKIWERTPRSGESAICTEQFSKH